MMDQSTDSSTPKPCLSDTEMEAQSSHPRSHLSPWRWRGLLVTIYLCCSVVGYDVSNVANIQPRLYQAFGHIDLLPWVGLSYALANFCVVSLARKLTLAFDLRLIFLSNVLVFMAGSAVAGSAGTMTAIIVGRVIMGVGGSIVQQACFAYFAVLGTTSEMALLYGVVGASWALGLVLGGPVGAAFAENPSTTWRWAFYLNIPILGAALCSALVCLPSHSLADPAEPLSRRVRRLDPLGIFLHVASGSLFAVAVTFSGGVWTWGQASDVAAWALFGVVLVSWGLQQRFCVFTSEQDRAFPVHMLSRLDLLPLWTTCFCAGASYAVTLYYAPLFFAFARGSDAMQQTVRSLPFILLFILCVSLTGRLLPRIGRYFVIYVVGGVLTLAGGLAMTQILNPSVPQSQVLALEALMGMGVGMTFQHGAAISNVINRRPRDRVDSLSLCNMAQMGGISLVLAAAGGVFQNVGHKLLVEALGDEADKYSATEIREALGGVQSAVWQSEDPGVVRKGVEAVAEVLAREFYFVAAFGALCLVCGLLMKKEKLDFGLDEDEDEKTEDVEASETSEASS